MKTLIAIPCMSMVHMDFATSLMNMRKLPGTTWAPKIGSLIYDSRNMLASVALQNEYDRVLWLDSDMVFKPDMLEQLSADMDENGLDIVSGLYFKRQLPTSPVIYGNIIYDTTDVVKAEAVTMYDYPKDDLFQIAGCGFGAVLTTCDALKRVWQQWGAPFDPMPCMGEDISFCWRCGQMGIKIYCDSRVKVGHAGTMIYDEKVYLSQATNGLLTAYGEAK